MIGRSIFIAGIWMRVESRFAGTPGEALASPLGLGAAALGAGVAAAVCWELGDGVGSGPASAGSVYESRPATTSVTPAAVSSEGARRPRMESRRDIAGAA